MANLVFGKPHPLEICTADSRNKKLDALIELTVLQKHVGAWFIAERNVAGNSLSPLFPGVVDEQLRMAVTAVMTNFATRQNPFSQDILVLDNRILAHATNLAIVPLSFALTHDDITLRVVRVRDWKTIERIQLENRDWFRQWEATNPTGTLNLDFKASIRGLLRQLDDESALPLVIEYRGELVGQLNISNIIHGSVGSAFIGYWISPKFAGLGITPVAVALATDYAFNVIGLHRIEIDIRPENKASLRVVQKLGFRYEGTKLAFIHINNAWRDHHVFALTFEEVRDGLLNRFASDQIIQPKYPFD